MMKILKSIIALVALAAATVAAWAAPQNAFVNRDWEFAILLKEEDGDPVNVTGSTWTFNLRDQPGASPVTLTGTPTVTSGPDGQLYMAFTAAQMTMIPGNYFAELVRTDTGLDVQATWEVVVAAEGQADAGQGTVVIQAGDNMEVTAINNIGVVDLGSLADGDYGDMVVTGSGTVWTLDADNTRADEQCLTWEADSSKFSWQGCGGGAGGLVDADYGDITVSGGATVWTIDPNAVTLGTDTTGGYAASATEGGPATSVADTDFGDVTITGGVWSIDLNAVTLGTDTVGNYAAGDAEAGAALTGDSATAFFTTGTLEDARIDGSLEADEVVLAGDVDGAANANDLDEVAVEGELEAVLDLADLQGDVALGTKTSGNYVADVADGTGIDGTATGEGSTYTPSLDLTEISSAVLGNGTTSSLQLGTIELGAATDTTLARSSAGNVSIEGNVIVRSGTAAGGDLTGTYPSPTITTDAVALTTDTSGNYAAGDAEAGNALTGDSATAFFSTGTLEDARVDGSLEADEVNPTLGTQTQGNYLASVSAGVGNAVTGTPGEGWTATVAFDFSDAGANPTLAANEARFTSVTGNIVFEGSTADGIETRVAVTDPTTSDRTFTIPNADSVAVQPFTCTGSDKISAISAAGVISCNVDAGGGGATLADGDYGDIVVSGTGTIMTIDLDAVALGTDTTGNYVATVADGTGIDGTCSSETCTYTPVLDLTELSTATFGAGAFTTLVFDAGATDPTFTMASNSITVSNAATFSLGTAATFTSGTIELGAATDTTLARSSAGNVSIEGNVIVRAGSTAGGDLGGTYPSPTVTNVQNDAVALTTDTTGNYVGSVADGTGIDGTAAGEGATYTPTLDLTEITTATWGTNNFTTETYSTDGVDLTWDYSTTDAVATLSGGGTTPGVALDDQGFVRFLEEDAGGSNYKAFQAPATVTADTTCTFEDDANFIPDTCVGDGSDDDVPEVGDFGALVGGTGIDNNAGTLDLDLTEVTTAVLGNGTTSSLQVGTIELGAATDTTISRASAGDIAVEGNTVVRSGTSAGGDLTGTYPSPTITTNAVALGTDTTGNYVDDVLAGTGIAVTHTPAEGSDATVAFSYTDKGTDVTLNADECVFSSDATTAGNLVCEGDTANTAESRMDFGDPTADRVFTLPDANSYPITDKDYSDITVSASGQTWVVDADAIALTTDTTGSYVQQVADGTGIDGTANAEGATYTPTLDLTEISSATWGAGAFTTFTFDAGAVDPTLTFGSGTLLIEAVTSLRQADATNAGGRLQFLEDPGTGANFIAFLAPAAITSDVTCTFENDANPIPDSCVGDGTDGGGGDSLRVEDGDNAGTFTAMSDADFDDSGDINFARAAGPPDVVTATVRADAVALGTDTTGSYVAQVADGTGIDGTCNTETCTYTPSLDTTEVNDTTWGDNSDATIAWTFNQSGVTIGDPVLEFGDGALTITAGVFSRLPAAANAGGQIAVMEDPDNGANYIAIQAPTTITSNVTCTLENDANPIPDSCVGDGTDGGGSATPGGADTNVQYNDGGSFGGDTGFLFNETTDTITVLGNIELGSATDTTLARSSAGNVSIEGNVIVRAGSTASGDLGGTYPSPTVTNVQNDAVALTTDTTGNYVGTVAAGVGIAVTGVDAENATKTVAFDFSDATGDPGLAADECRFTSNATVAGNLVCEGDTANTIESRIAFTDPTTSDKVFTIPDANSYPITDKDYTDITVSASGQTWSIDADSVALTTDTTGVYVAQVADGTGVDGTANAEGATYTPTLDLTELNTFTLGAGAATGIIFDAGATDPAIEVASGSMTIDIGGTNETTLTASAFSPGVDAGSDLGTTTLAWNALHGDTGFVLNIENGDWVATHTTGILTVGTGDLRVTTAGTNTASVVTVGGTQTLTGKSIAATQITSGTLNIGNNAATVGTIELANGTANTLSGSAGVLSIEGAALAFQSITLTAGTGISGGGDLSANRSFALDTTEVSSATWGAGAFTSFTFDAGAVDPVLTFGSGTVLIEGVTSLRQADAANAGGQLRLLEDPGTGSNFIAFLAPAAITSDVTCTLENDANPIPDSCVGDGTDGGGAGSPGGSDTQVQYNDAGAFGGDAGLTFNETTDVLSMGGFTVVSGTLTDPKTNSITQTWNDAADTFKGLSIDITSTAAAAASKAFEINYAGSPYFRVGNGAQGDIQFFTGNSGVQFAESSFAWFARVAGADVFRIQSSGDWRMLVAGSRLQIGDRAVLTDDAADILAQRDGTDAQTFRIYNTFTDASNYERAFSRWSSNVFEFGTEAAGTGANRNMAFLSGSNIYTFNTATSVASSLSGTSVTPSMQISGTNSATSTFENSRFSNDVNPPRNFFNKSRGTSVGSFTIVQDGDDLGEFVFAGADGTDMASAAAFRVEVDGTPGDNDMPGRIVFSTSADGGQTVSDALVIKSNGVVIVGVNDALSQPGLHLNDQNVLRFYEADANGDEFVAFVAPSSIGSSATCTFENDASFIPDACVGDGVDAGAGGGISNVVEDTTPTLGGNLEGASFTVGTAASQVEDLYLEEGAEINWDNGDATLTQSGDTITWSGVTAVSFGTSTVVTLGSIELGAASDTTIARSAAGEATIEGDAVKHAGKQVMWVPASAMKNDATSPASCGDAYDSGSNDVSLFVCAFDTGATEERADFSIAMPKAWNEGTITYQALWTNTAGLTTETVQWELACVAISDDDPLNATMGTSITVSDTWLAQNDLHVTAESSALTIGGTPAENDFVTCRINRDTSADNMTGDALLIGVRIFWTDNASTLAE